MLGSPTYMLKETDFVELRLLSPLMTVLARVLPSLTLFYVRKKNQHDASQVDIALQEGMPLIEPRRGHSVSGRHSLCSFPGMLFFGAGCASKVNYMDNGHG